jgi:hypothetical protein
MESITQLYEQEPPNKRNKRLRQYILRWIRWVRSGFWIMPVRQTGQDQTKALPYYLSLQTAVSIEVL